jgi:hypothetical protein
MLTLRRPFDTCIHLAALRDHLAGHAPQHDGIMA